MFQYFPHKLDIEADQNHSFKTNGNLPITYPLSQKICDLVLPVNVYQISTFNLTCLLWARIFFSFKVTSTLDTNALAQFVPVACNFNNNKIKKHWCLDQIFLKLVLEFLGLLEEMFSLVNTNVALKGTQFIECWW